MRHVTGIIVLSDNFDERGRVLWSM